MTARRTLGHDRPAPLSSLFVVEVKIAGDDPNIAGLSGRARAAAASLEAAGRRVRYVRTVYVPERDACLLVFEAASADLTREAAGKAGADVVHVSPTLAVERR